MVENSKTNTPLPKKPPYYKNLTTSTPYYCDKSLENISNQNIYIGSRKYNVVDDIYFTFQLINQETCLTFEKTDEPITNTIGINFNISADKSIVNLSFTENSPTNVSLLESDYKNATVLTFYIGLAMGLIPEVGRPDRDIDVNVSMTNVTTDYQKYYKIANKSEVLYLNDTDFDFKSAMFFGSDFGLSNGKQSTYIVELYKDYQYPSSVSTSFSHNDYKHMHYYYCDGSKKQKICKYGGYPLPKESNICKCPYYLEGDNCEKFILEKNIDYKYARPTTEKSLVANKTKQYFFKNLTNEIYYLNITSQNNKNVSIVVEDLTFGRTNCTIGRSYLEIFVRNDKGAAGVNLCRNSANITLPSLSNEVLFVFKAIYENTSLNISYTEANETVNKI
uniref:Astacin domain-containing protein n=1 Tax=Strongyloides papillosus TaxID=174720 RepID=A0A0N5C2Q9_STREA